MKTTQFEIDTIDEMRKEAEALHERARLLVKRSGVRSGWLDLVHARNELKKVADSLRAAAALREGAMRLEARQERRAPAVRRVCGAS